MNLDDVMELGVHLGWNPHRKSKDFDLYELVWFEDGSIDDVLFQINTSPSLRVCVYAIPWGVCTCWHLINESADLPDEVKRLEPIVARKWFDSEKSIRKFAERHLDFSNFSADDLTERIPKKVYPF